MSERQPERRPPFEIPEAVLELEPATEPAPAHPVRPGRMHIVVVVTRAVTPADAAPPGAVLMSRFWHPSLHRWSENSFESLEHAIHLFVDESGWALRQQQPLDVPHAHELVFEARREDFSRPGTEAMLEDVGLTREDVADLIDRVERENGGA
ncbi:MAG: hypothetical protein M3Q93_07770 [Gemmatimonadota bacterium]|nr:hypothetical protein [Gemmatimonadales bacterium]MDQ3137468.1 hypothetical protein [Gemmatimonadota bacterium]